MHYSIQLSFNNAWRTDKDIVCTCGHRRKVAHNIRVGACPECGECRVKTAYTDHRNKINYIDNMFNVVSKDDSYFHIKRQEVSISATKETIKVNPTHVGELTFSMKTKKFTITRDGKKLSPTDANINNFFKGADKERVLSTISTPRNKELFKFCYENLGKIGYERSQMWGRALSRLRQYPAIEVIGLSLVNNHLQTLWYSCRNVLDTKELQPPHKTLGVPKFAIKYLAKMPRLGSYQLSKIQELCGYFDGNSVKLIFEIFEDESDMQYIEDVAETLIELFKDYGYNDLKRTILFITREVKLEQGISSPSEAVELLRDYARMSQDMGVKYDKYPKSLKKDHDIALMNYKAKESELKQEQFSKVIESEEYAQLEYKAKDYSIVHPTHVKEVISEGKSLSHCVASYVDDIIKKKCKIFFLRRTSSLDEPLITVEVRGKHVRQVRGRFSIAPK
ncbi:PcfJ domain-containing protein [Pseudobacillus badius]|uniref:PcfJ domain-containing protein n=1 Tax=Bacillus badius TaxID=1455 RepID=UPI0007B3E71D|nr:PcfJ domain-containing protein [Bacillus badius]KZR57928.1 hypothetical protein A3781_19315 [Bacillus badius]